MDTTIVVDHPEVLLDQSEEALEELLRLIFVHSLPTGSVHWGLETDSSEHDSDCIAYLSFYERYIDRQKLLEVAARHIDPFTNRPFPSPHLRFSVRLQNGKLVKVHDVIFCTSTEQYNKWMECDEAMAVLIKNTGFGERMKDKAKRVEMFNALRKIVGLV